MAKSRSESTVERVYNVPLRKGYMKSPRWKRTKKAVFTLREFLSKHMKSDDVKIGKRLNERLWKDGIRNPPHHIKLKAVKDGEGVVKAELFGFDYEEKKIEEKKAKPVKKEVNKEEEKKEVKKTEEKEESSVEIGGNIPTKENPKADAKQEAETKKDSSKKE